MAQTTFPFAQTFAQMPSQAAATLSRPVRPDMAQPPEAPAGLDATGFAIGWEHARHQLTPPLAHLHAASPVRQGWSAGRAAFGARALKASPVLRQWLALRLDAWQHGEAFEDVQVTPHFLSQLQGHPQGGHIGQSALCPVTRLPLQALTAGPAGADAAVVHRLNPQAAYAAGNLVLLHRSAAAACAPLPSAGPSAGAPALRSLPLTSLLTQAQRVAETTAGTTLRGLDARAWLRLAVLASFATPLPHGQAASLPLVVLPPNRVRVINPVQALQVMLTLQFTQAGYARRLLTLAALMPGSEARQAFQIFMHTLLARRLAAGQEPDAMAVRQAMEDSWWDPLVQRRWQRLALWLSEADCERLLQRASRRQLCVGGGRWLSSQAATEGWAMTETKLTAVVTTAETPSAPNAAVLSGPQARPASRWMPAVNGARSRGPQLRGN